MIFDRKVILAVTCSAGVFFRAAAAAEGKSTKGTKSQSNPVPLYFLNPSSCPQKCAQCAYGQGTPPEVDGHGTGEAVQPCDAENIHQMWRLHQKDGLTMIESNFNPGECLAVVPPQEEEGRRKLNEIFPILSATQPSVLAADMCNGSVGLVPCNDPAAQWLFNGANLISSLCWKTGISSFLTVNEECSELSVMAADGGNDALFRSQTFMLTEQDFIETIVPVPDDPSGSEQDHGGRPYGGYGAIYASPGLVGAIVEPGDESEPATPAVCNNPTCDKKQVCAKYSTDADGKCFTQCSNDAITGRRCEIPGETCVHNYDDKSGIMTHWCDCEPDSESSEGEKEVDGKWACLAA